MSAMIPMAFEDYRAGRVRPHPVTRVAENAAVWLSQQAFPLAVCMSRTRVVTVEVPGEAYDDEIVGTYDPALGLIELYRRIRDDLKHEVELRAKANQ